LSDSSFLHGLGQKHLCSLLNLVRRQRLIHIMAKRILSNIRIAILRPVVPAILFVISGCVSEGFYLRTIGFFSVAGLIFGATPTVAPYWGTIQSSAAVHIQPVNPLKRIHESVQSNETNQHSVRDRISTQNRRERTS
jgi:hypothetical protein